MADRSSSPTSNHAAENDHGAANTPLPPDAMLAAVEGAMDAVPDAVPDALPDNMPPPPPPVKTRHVSLTFNGSGGQSVTFKLKDTMKFRKAMDHYSAKVQLPVDQLRFLFEGQRLGLDDTPATHEMEDGDIVDVHMEQLGGGCTHPNEDCEEDWVFVAVDEEMLQRTLTEKARLLCTFDRLKKELNALKAENRALVNDKRALANTNQFLADNNHGLAQEYSLLKQDAKALNNENNSLFAQLTELLGGLGLRLARLHTFVDDEIRGLKASIDQRDRAIDAILRDYQVEFGQGESISGM